MISVIVIWISVMIIYISERNIAQQCANADADVSENFKSELIISIMIVLIICEDMMLMLMYLSISKVS